MLFLKMTLREKMLAAYRSGDKAVLESIAVRDIPEVIAAVGELLAAFRIQWFRSFKPYGLELMQIRLGGLCERYRELARRLQEYTTGKIPEISEFENPITPIGQYALGRYLNVATGGFFI